MEALRLIAVLDSSRAEREARELGDSLRKALAPSMPVFKSMADAVKDLTGALGSLGRRVGEMIALSAKQEIFDQRIVDGLRSRVKFTDQAWESLQRFNAETAKSTGYGTQQLLQVESMLALLGALPSEIQRATKAAIAITETSAGSMSLGESARAVARALQGDVNALVAGGIRTKDIGRGLKELEDRFHLLGNQTNTFSGKTKVLEQAWEGLQRSFGNAITSSPEVRKAIESITAQLTAMTGEVDAGKAAIGGMVSGAITDLEKLVKFIRENETELKTFGAVVGTLATLMLIQAKIPAAIAAAKGAAAAAGGAAALAGTPLVVGGMAAAGAVSVGAMAAEAVNRAGSIDRAKIVAGILAGMAGRPGGAPLEPDRMPEGPALPPGGINAVTFEAGEGAAVKIDAKSRKEAARAAKERLDNLRADHKARIDEMDEFLADAFERGEKFRRQQQDQADAEADLSRQSIARLKAANEERFQIEVAEFDRRQQRDQLELEQQLASYRAMEKEQADFMGPFILSQKGFWKDVEEVTFDATRALGQIGTQGIADWMTGMAVAIGTGESVLSNSSKFFGGLLMQMGQAAIGIGTIAVLAGTLGTVAPWLGLPTGSLAGAAAGAALVVGGGALVALGAAMGGAGGGAAAAAPRPSGGASVPRAGFGESSEFTPSPGFRRGGEAGTTHVHIHVEGLLHGTRRSLGREISDLLRESGTLRVGG